MYTKETIFDLCNKKIHAYDTKNKEELDDANSKLYGIKRQYIQRAKSYISQDNSYKKYLTENVEDIKSRFSLNKSVETTEDAIKVLQESADMRALFGINNSSYTEIFESDIFFKEQYFEGIEDTKEEADISMATIINNKEFIKINFGIEENVGLAMWMYKVSMYTSTLKGYIRFDTINRKQLYYLKSNEESNDYSYNVYFDIIELFEIVNNCSNRYSAIKELCKLLNIKIEYVTIQENKYVNNLKILKDDNQIKSNHLILYKCLNYHIHMLEIINIEGNEHIKNSLNSYQGNNIVAFSNEFIGNKAVCRGDNKEDAGIVKNTKGTVNPKINLFCLLGLLIKVPFDKLTKNQRYKATGYKREENSYIVPFYSEELLEEAERRVIKLSEGKVKPTKLSGEKCMKIFGDGEIYRNVYGNYYKIGA